MLEKETQIVIETLRKKGFKNEKIIAIAVAPNIADAATRNFLFDVCDHLHTLEHGKKMNEDRSGNEPEWRFEPSYLKDGMGAFERRIRDGR